MKKKLFTLQVTTSLDMHEVIALLHAVRDDDNYIRVEAIGERSKNKPGRPRGAGAFDKTAAAKATATMQARLNKSVEILAELLQAYPNVTMETYCAFMTSRGATNRRNQPWTPKNLWPYYEKAYAIVEGKIQLAYKEKPEGASADEFATT